MRRLLGTLGRAVGLRAAPAQAEPDADRVRLDFPGCDIWLHATSDMETRWRAKSCAKEPWTVAWLEHHVSAGEVVYDIGANVGAFSLIAARHRGATVVAFEPGYATFARLCENIQLNGCQHTIIPLPFPVADATRLVGFRYRSLDPGQSRHALTGRRWQARPGEPGARYEQPVCAMRLDEAIAQFRLPAPNHLKIDVDGAEARVLAGAPKVLRSPALRTVLIEADAGGWDAIESTLLATGFELVERYGRQERKPGVPVYGLFRSTRPT